MKFTAPGTYQFILEHDAQLRQGDAIQDGYTTALSYQKPFYTLVITDPMADAVSAFFAANPAIAYANAKSTESRNTLGGKEEGWGI